MRHTLLLGCLAVLCSALPAAGQDQRRDESAPSAAVQREYRELAAHAISEFEAGHFADARSTFLRAHRLWPSARTFRTLGMTAFDLGLYPQALSELQAALADQRRPLDSTQRAQVAALIERTRERVGSFRLQLLPPDASLTIDGLAWEPAQPGELRLANGVHELVARAPGYRVLHHTLEVRGQHDEPFELVLDKEPALQPAAAASSVPNPQPATGREQLTRPVAARDAFATARQIAFIVGALGLATGISAGVLAWDRGRTVDRECGDAKLCSERGLSAADSGKTLMAISDLGSAVGALGLGTWLLLPGGFLNGAAGEHGVALVLRGDLL